MYKFWILYQLLKIAREFYPEYSPFVFAWDHKKKVRKLINKTYKEGRKSPLTKDDIEQFNILRKDVLPGIGFQNNFISNGLEADDIIAMVTKLYKGKKMIVSSDTDLYQLLDEDTSMYKSTRKEIYTSKDFEEEWDIKSTLWPLVKAIAGCATDNVAGITKGLGEKTAIKFLKREKINEKIRKEICTKGKEIVKKNLRLVLLPFDGIINPYFVKPDKLSIDAFELICTEYGFKVFLKDRVEWKQIFRMK